MSYDVMVSSNKSKIPEVPCMSDEFREKAGYDLDLSEKHLAYWAYHTVPEGGDPAHSQAGEGFALFKEENASDVYDNGGTGIIATSVYRFPQDRSERSVPIQHRRQVCHRRIRAQHR